MVPDPLIPIFYSIEGYHGGYFGHFPIGCMRDMLNELDRWTHWKVSLELEPVTWEHLRQTDPWSYQKLQHYLQDNSPSARVEIVSPAYGQPYAWNINGESNIRQLIIGLAETRKHFPTALVDTYAVQEPCWTSALPQILLSLGFKRASLKDPSTAFGGYTRGIDANLIRWVGPDGSAIPTAPRYACEHLVRAWETESRYGTMAFAQKCAVEGISAPAGQWYMDAGWTSGPGLREAHIRHTTWREYFSMLPTPFLDKVITQEDFQVALTWGEAGLQRLARIVREAENKALMAEKTAAIAWLTSRHAWQADGFNTAWQELLLSQHHDVWIVGFGSYARNLISNDHKPTWFQMGEQWASHSAQTFTRITQDSQRATHLAVQAAASDTAQWVRLFNTQSSRREEVVSIPVSSNRGTRSFTVYDAQHNQLPAQHNQLPAQHTVLRRFADPSRDADAIFKPWVEGDGEDICAAQVIFPAQIPAYGWVDYLIEPSPDLPSGSGPVTVTACPGCQWVILTDRFQIKLDGQKGGTISSWVDRASGKEWVNLHANRKFNEYRGFYINENRWISSADSPAQITVLESGPLRAVVMISGRIGPAPFTTRITCSAGEPRVDFDVQFDLKPDTWIGEPWEGGIIPRENPRKPCYDDRFKLQACFPLPFAQPVLDKNAAFDVCRSQQEDTHFNSWSDLKHTVLLEWLDVSEADQSQGMSLFCDHTTGYVHSREESLGLVLGWSGAGMWNRIFSFSGQQGAHYALLPHRGDWEQACIWQAHRAWAEPVQHQLLGAPSTTRNIASLLETSPGLDLVTTVVEQNNLTIRLFNPSSHPIVGTITFHFNPGVVDRMELDGRVITSCPVTLQREDQWRCTVSLPRFGIGTLRLSAMPNLSEPTG